jgi:hypothetical protein
MRPSPPRHFSRLKGGLVFFTLMMVIGLIDALGAFKGIPVLGWDSPESITWRWLVSQVIKNGLAALIYGWFLDQYLPTSKESSSARTS